VLGFTRQIAVAGIVVAALAFAIRADKRVAVADYQGGSSSPLVRAFTWIDTFRNPINGMLRGIEPNIHPTPLDKPSVDYLHAHTRKRERVAIICGAEWNYLAAAGRAPRLHWLQLFLVHSPLLLDRCIDDLKHADRVFVDRDALPSLKGVNPAAHIRVARILENEFELADRSTTKWDLYRKKPGQTAGR
jgi:hypothetical protein